MGLALTRPVHASWKSSSLSTPPAPLRYEPHHGRLRDSSYKAVLELQPNPLPSTLYKRGSLFCTCPQIPHLPLTTSAPSPYHRTHVSQSAAWRTPQQHCRQRELPLPRRHSPQRDRWRKTRCTLPHVRHAGRPSRRQTLPPPRRRAPATQARRGRRATLRRRARPRRQRLLPPQRQPRPQRPQRPPECH